jgi:hypothetical protein
MRRLISTRFLKRPATRSSVRGLLALVLLGSGTLLALPLLGNGGTLRLANVEMGNYLVSAFTDPTPVRPDSLDVSVLVLERGIQGVPEGLDVRISARHVDGKVPPQEEVATRETADDPRYYAAKFTLGAPGTWELTLRVRGEQGEGEASFTISARDPGLLGNPWILLLMGLLPLGVLGVWLLRDREDGGDGAPSGVSG